MGIAYLTLLGSEGASGASSWKSNFGLDGAYVAGDPQWSMNVNATPTTHLIDPRSMEVVDIEVGFSGSFSWIESLANQNKI